PGVPDAIAGVIERGLAKPPRQRQPNAEELGRQLQSAQERAGIAVTAMHLAGEDSGAMPDEAHVIVVPADIGSLSTRTASPVDDAGLQSAAMLKRARAAPTWLLVAVVAAVGV